MTPLCNCCLCHYNEQDTIHYRRLQWGWENHGQAAIVARGSKGGTNEIINETDFAIIMAQEEQVAYSSSFVHQFEECCRLAVLEMIKEAALHDRLVLMPAPDGSAIKVRAKEVLQKNPDFKLRNVIYTPAN